MYIFIDFEMNQWKKKEEDLINSEIIEIGAVKMDHRMKIIDQFSEKIKPTLCMRLNEYIKKLTGIKEEELHAADPFEVRMQSFETWMGADNEIHQIYVWGTYDTYQILKESDVKQYQGRIVPLFQNKLIDFQRELESAFYIQKNSIGLKKSLQLFDLYFYGKNHRAVDDALNLARLFKAFYQNPDKVAELKDSYSIKTVVDKENRRRSRMLDSMQEDIKHIIKQYAKSNIKEVETYLAWLAEIDEGLKKIKNRNDLVDATKYLNKHEFKKYDELLSKLELNDTFE